MNAIYRNPFAVRASEKIAEDNVFIRLFSTEPLGDFIKRNNNDSLWGDVVKIQSSPGGGKTTVLRLFSPSVLLKIMRYRNSPEFKGIYHTLKSLNVFSKDGIDKVGAYLLIGRDFNYINDLQDYTDAQKMRTFMALMNSRVVLSILKTIIDFKGIEISKLDKVEFNPPKGLSWPVEGLAFPCTGQELYDWSVGIEDKICDALDNLSGEDKFVGHKNLFSFELFKAAYFSYEGKAICDEFIIQLDDVHKLASEQYRCLEDEIVAKRITSSVWLAGRWENYSLGDILHHTNKDERDSRIINLETTTESAFTKQAQDVAVKRSALSENNFRLETSLDDKVTIDFDPKYKESIQKCKSELRSIIGENNVLDIWYEMLDGMDSVEEQAIAYKAVLIFMSREQSSVILFPYTEEDYKNKINSDLLKLAARLILSEYKLPMYYGFRNLVRLSDYNIEQFIGFSFKLYESLLNKLLLHQGQEYDIRLEAAEQDKVIRRQAKAMFDHISVLPMGGAIKSFLEQILQFCYKVTHKTASSYKVVSGFAISVNECRRNYDDWYEKKEFADLAEMIRICLANNLLRVSHIAQGGDEWDVYYINRWLCVQAGLPFDFGGWQAIKMRDIQKMIER